MTKISNQYSLTNVLTADVINGRVGINNGSPSVALDVTGAGKFSTTLVTGGSATFGSDVFTYASGGIFFSGAAVYTSGIFQNASGLQLQSGGTPRLSITATGNVGIGTTSPTVAGGAFTGLDIRGSGGGSLVLGSTSSAFSFIYANSSALFIESTSTIPITFVTNAAERMRITSTGQLLVGTSTAFVGTSYPIQAASGGNGAFAARGLGPGDANFLSTSSSIGYHFYADNQSSVRFYVLTNGDVRNLNNSYGAISDISLKENITDATPKLDDLLKVKIRNYNLISDEDKTKQIGVIAQELEEIFPSLISEDIVMNSDEKIKTVKYSVFVPMLIKAIQELSADLTSAKQEIELLKAK